jgi:type-F conjugative transfer system pilin assembly protein TrbC
MIFNNKRSLQRVWLIALILFFAYISFAKAQVDLGDANATQEELTLFNEKYLKHKLQNDSHVKSTSTTTLKISDIATFKDVNKSIKQIEDSSLAQSLNQPYNSEHAKRIEEYSHSTAFRQAVKDNKKYLLENYTIGGKLMEQTPQTKAFIQESATHDGKETLFIIISSSMPEADIREYFKRLEGKEGVIFILRGLVGSEKRFGPTKEYLEKIVKKHPTDPNNQEVFNVAVEINPKVTRKYSIEKVPAFVYVSHYRGQLGTSAPIDQSVHEPFWVAYGTASLEYILEQINTEAKSTWLSSLMEKETFFNAKDENH